MGRGLTVQGGSQWGDAGHSKVRVCKQSTDPTIDESRFVPNMSQERISHTDGIYRREMPNYSLELYVHTLPGDVRGRQ